MIAIFDLDGTVADCAHRRYHVQKTPPSREAFYAALDEDAIIDATATIWRALKRYGATILVCSGRNEGCRPATELWLKRHDLAADAMYFRPAHDYRPDDTVKQDLLAEIITAWGEVPDIAFEDRQRCVDMWRRNGIFCCQVTDGAEL
jgi:hypothetical protein